MTCSQEPLIVVVNTSRLNHLGKNFATAAGVEEKESISGTLLGASSIWKFAALAHSAMWNIISL